MLQLLLLLLLPFVCCCCCLLFAVIVVSVAPNMSRATCAAAASFLLFPFFSFAAFCHCFYCCSFFLSLFVRPVPFMSQNADRHRLFIYLFMYYMQYYMCVRVCVCYSRAFFDILLAAAAASGINHCSQLFLIAMLDYDMSSSLLCPSPVFSPSLSR